MSDCKTCERCGCELRDETAGGLCPRCLMTLSFASRTMPEGEKPDLAVSLSPEEMRQHFPQYEILECLGRGGMGVVYKARQKALDRLVAIKVLAGERQGDVDFARRFESEAKLLAQMNHPNIITVHDFGEADGLYYIVMEYVDGVNLRDLLADGKMDPKQALAIVPPVCEALEYAHEKGVVHRDIKPENLLLDRDGRVKIADFGIASLVGADGEKSGTPPYMAPEQEKGVVDQRADIYALGAVLYEMLTGERPGKDLVAPSKRVEIDVRIDEIVLRALDKEPERRYQTATEFRTMIETMATGQMAPSQEKVDSEARDTACGKHGILSRLSAVVWRQPLKVSQAVGLGLLAALVGHFLAFGVSEGIGNELLHLPPKVTNFTLSAGEGVFSVIAIVVILLSLSRLSKLALATSGLSAFLIFCILLPSLGNLFQTETFLMAVILSNFCLLPVMVMAWMLKREFGAPLAETTATIGTPLARRETSRASVRKSVKSGPFRRFWWLFLIALAFGVLADTLFGMRLMTRKGAAFYRAGAGINVIGGSPKELAAIKAAITKTDTLKEVAKRLDLAREWGCRPESVVPRLRKLIDTRIVGDSTMVALDVPQTRYKNKNEALQIADTITAAVIDQARKTEALLLEPSPAGAFRFRDWFAVRAMAIAGLFLGISLGYFLIILFHRRLPQPVSRRLATRLAALLMAAVIVMAGLGVKRLLEMRAAAQWQFPIKQAHITSPQTAARAFMKAMRDGKADSAIAWWAPASEPGPAVGAFGKEQSAAYSSVWRSDLEDFSNLLREAYTGEMGRLTKFTEWSPEQQIGNASYVAARVAPTSNVAQGKDGANGLYLVLISKPEGWRVLCIGFAKPDESLSDYLAPFTHGSVLAFPVTPPLTIAPGLRLPIPDSERLNLVQVKKSLKRIRWGQFLRALAAEGQDDRVAVREVSSGDGNRRRFETAFRWGDQQMVLDLVVDPAWTQAEPARLRNAANPDQNLYASATGIMSELTVTYMQKTDPVLKAEIAARARHAEDVKMLRQYASAVGLYSRSHGDVFAPDMASLLEERWGYLGVKKATEGLMKNDETGTMQRPIYHGNSELHLTDVQDDPNFIMVAAPSPDAEGRRLVLFGNGIYIRAITEETYQQQIAKQAKGASLKQAARCFMAAMRAGDVDSAMIWVTPEMKAVAKTPLFLGLISKQLRDEVYTDQLDRLTEFPEMSVTNVDGNRQFVTIRVAAPSGQSQDSFRNGLYLIVVPTPDGWRVARFDGFGQQGSLAKAMRTFLTTYATTDMARPPACPRRRRKNQTLGTQPRRMGFPFYRQQRRIAFFMDRRPFAGHAPVNPKGSGRGGIHSHLEAGHQGVDTKLRRSKAWPHIC